jgi:hypothetical protein
VRVAHAVIMEIAGGDAKSIRGRVGLNSSKRAQSDENNRADNGTAEIGDPIEGIEALSAGDELLVEFVEGSGEGKGCDGREEKAESSGAERAAQRAGQRAGPSGKEDEMQELVLVGEDFGHVFGRWRSGEEKEDCEPHGEQCPKQRGAAKDRGERAAEDFHARRG